MNQTSFSASSTQGQDSFTDTSVNKHRNRSDKPIANKLLKSFKIKDKQVLWSLNEFLDNDRVIHNYVKSATTIALESICRRDKVNSAQAVEVYFHMQDILISLKKHPELNTNVLLYNSMVSVAVFLMAMFDIKHINPRLITYTPHLKNGGKK